MFKKQSILWNIIYFAIDFGVIALIYRFFGIGWAVVAGLADIMADIDYLVFNILRK